MCWSILFILILTWRIVRWMLNVVLYIMTLMPVVGVRIFQAGQQRTTDVHRSRDTTLDTLVGMVLLVGLVVGTVLLLSAPFIAFVVGLITVAHLALLVSGQFRLFDVFVTPAVDILSRDQLNVVTVRVSVEQSRNMQQAEYIIRQLVSAYPNLLFRIEADATQVRWQVMIPVRAPSPQALQSILLSTYPDGDVSVDSLNERSLPADAHQQLLLFEQTQPFAVPLRATSRDRHYDAISTLSQMMNDLNLGEHVSLVLAVGDVVPNARTDGWRQITRSSITLWHYLSRQGTTEALQRLLQGDDRLPREDEFDVSLVKEKLRSRLYHAALWVTLQTTSSNRLAQLRHVLSTYVTSLSSSPYNVLSFAGHVEGNASNPLPDLLDLYRRWRRDGGRVRIPTLILNPDELTTVWHLPHEAVTASRVSRVPKIRPISEFLAHNREGAVLGDAQYHREWQDVRITEDDRRQHLNIVGRTGMGKSNFMHHLIRQDIASGRGVAVIDPHGTLVKDILAWSIPPHREADVVLLDLGDRNHPPPINPVAKHTKYVGAMSMVAIIERLFVGTESAAQMSNYLRAALLLLQAETRTPTMQDIQRIFYDDVYRGDLLSRTTHPQTKTLWEEQYNPLKLSAKRHIAAPIINRVRPFYANPYLYPVLCHPDSLDFRSLIDQEKIILISLAVDSGLVPQQERDLLGAFLMSRLQMEGMDEVREIPYFIYVDEVQKFVTTSLPELFSEARKYGLALTVANQFLNQLDDSTLKAVLGNTGTTVVFRCSPEDTRRLSAYVQPDFDAHDLANLNRFQAIVRMQSHHQTQPPFTLFPKKPVHDPDRAARDAADRVARIRRTAYANYTPKTRAEVLAWLNKRYSTHQTTSSFLTSDSAEMDDDMGDFME